MFLINQKLQIHNQVFKRGMKGMSFPRNILISLLVTPLVVFFSRSVSAFSITPSQPGATDFYYPETEYTVNRVRSMQAIQSLTGQPQKFC